MSDRNKTENQYRKQYEWLKEYQFQKGQSGNPAGRPKGKTLKEFTREFLENMSDEARIEFLSNIDPDIIWRMAEGNPRQDTDVTSGGKPIPIYGGLSIQGHDSNKEDIQPSQEN